MFSIKVLKDPNTLIEKSTNYENIIFDNGIESNLEY